MTEKPGQHGKKPRIEKLDLKPETVAERTETEAEGAKGGALRAIKTYGCSADCEAIRQTDGCPAEPGPAV